MNKLLLARYRALITKALEYVFANGDILAKLYSSANSRESQTIGRSGMLSLNFEQQSFANLKSYPIENLYMHITNVLQSSANSDAIGTENAILQSVTVLRTMSAAVTYGIVWGRGGITLSHEHIAAIRSAKTERGRGYSAMIDRVIASLMVSGVIYGAGKSETGHGYIASSRDADIVHALGTVLMDLIDDAKPSVEDIETILMTVACYTATVANITSTSPEDLLAMTYSEMKSSASFRVQEPELIFAQSVTKLLTAACGIMVSYKIDVRGLLCSYLAAIGSAEVGETLSRHGESTTCLVTQSGVTAIRLDSPVFADGVLYIPAVYEAVQNGLIVDIGQSSVVQDGEILRVSSVYDVVQNENILDLAAFSVMQTDNVLNIRYVTGTKDSEILEVK